MDNLPLLKLKRSQPAQGKSVTVYFDTADGKNMGMLLLPYETWIAFSKLLQLGQEANAKQDYPVKLKLIIEGYMPSNKPRLDGATIPKPKPIKEAFTEAVTLEQAAEMQVEEDAEAELRAALVARASNEEGKLIRTLKDEEI